MLISAGRRGPDTSCAPAGRGEGGVMEGPFALLSAGEKALAFPQCILTPPQWGGEEGSLCFTNSLYEGMYRWTQVFPNVGVGKLYPTAFCSAWLPLSLLSGWRKKGFSWGFYFLV